MSKEQSTTFHLLEMIVIGGGIGWVIARLLDPDAACPVCPVCAGPSGGGGGGGGGSVLSPAPSGGGDFLASGPLDASGLSAIQNPNAAPGMTIDMPAGVTRGTAPTSSTTSTSSSSTTPSTLGKWGPGGRDLLPTAPASAPLTATVAPMPSPGPSTLPDQSSSVPSPIRPAAPPANAPGARIVPITQARPLMRRG